LQTLPAPGGRISRKLRRHDRQKLPSLAADFQLDWAPGTGWVRWWITYN
jgi:hypothetical protein